MIFVKICFNGISILGQYVEACNELERAHHATGFSQYSFFLKSNYSTGELLANPI